MRCWWASTCSGKSFWPRASLWAKLWPVIQLTCAQCQATLEVDDAFAGGVCRCQHCGTIQTVPRPGALLESQGTNGAAAAEAPRALYQVKSRSGASSAPSGLEELAEVIHSSGLSGSGLRNPPAGEIGVGHVISNRLPIILAIIGAVAVLAIATLVALLMKSAPAAAPATALPDGTVVPSAAGTGTPNFAGLDLSAGQKIIFLIDRGDATADFFPGLKALAARAVQSLGPDRKFQVILWDNGSVDAYPTLGPDFGTAEQASKLQAWLDDVATGRPTDVMPALKAALAQSPDTLVLVTAKSNQLTDSTPDFAADVLGQLGGRKIVIHAITLGQGAPGDPLKKIAVETGGHFIILSREDLDRLVG